MDRPSTDVLLELVLQRDAHSVQRSPQGTQEDVNSMSPTLPLRSGGGGGLDSEESDGTRAGVQDSHEESESGGSSLGEDAHIDGEGQVDENEDDNSQGNKNSDGGGGGPEHDDEGPSGGNDDGKSQGNS